MDGRNLVLQVAPERVKEVKLKELEEEFFFPHKNFLYYSKVVRIPAAYSELLPQFLRIVREYIAANTSGT